MNRFLLVVTLVMVSMGVITTPASAHVLVKDASGKRGAIVHIIPDDDPIAGKPATIYFDMQDSSNERATVMLTIVDERDQRTTVDLKRDASLANGSYVFPQQGVYELVFVYNAANRTDTYTYTQRVSRGLADSDTGTGKNTALGEAIAIGSGLSLAVLAIVRFNRRADIVRQHNRK